MNSVFFRVDDRLIHGQVVEGWAKFLHATKIIVIDDKVAADSFQKSIMEIAVPSDIKVCITTVEDSANEIRTCSEKKENTVALFSNLEDVFRAVTSGIKLDKLNLGGLRFEKGKKSISKTIFLNEHDAELLEKLLHMGIEINIQSIPSETQKNVQQVLEKNFKI
ncbi:MAG: hypothetical protein A2W05_09645 [Candidatus Schekmanbacteria bacterium RBG_16_38_10]|uniref:PTS EIIB type-4 domain-containing protein n=1 Tax=Candidatus Schekmanbacteria bacterium RBG_16_38_10 TaxID=1817879 RepID=A0A1F7RPZ5_9BACT|nr:MAG: hypothetical protein A2W05_09645 [Candidatus Schekmanbacteria bacterium RBG_16_38_10]